MIIKNCRIIYSDKIETGSVLIRDSKIIKINPDLSEDDTILDAEGLYLSPGFIDVHIHGAGGSDTMDGSYNAINNIAKTISKHGTTSFLPTTMTCSVEDIRKSVYAIAEAKSKGTEGANVLGVHLEGPFLSPEMIGAQNPLYIAKPSISLFKDMVGDHMDVVTTVTIAPEVEGALEFVKFLKDNNINPSMGHTKAKYSEAIEGIKCGVCHSTHLFNAMTPLHHREPGAIGAIFDTDITTETISDGIHINYASLRVAYKTKSTDKVLLVTDAMMACGMPDGLYALGGQDVIVKDGAARLKNGALAGSILTLDTAIRNVFKNSDYPLYEVVKMATLNAAKLCKVENSKGIIKEGFDADLVLFDEDINIKKVFVNGNLIHNA